jgi:D-threo-aldose 1-dehydrogenase
MNPVERLSLGRTGLSITRICFGTSALGDMPETYGYAVDADRARATVRAIFDSPVNFIDTSRNYGFGRSEERIGDVIGERGGLPEGFIVSTKLDRDMTTGRFDTAQARRSLEETLKSLRLEKIHLLHLHDPEHAASLSEITGPRGALAELFRMKEQGFAHAVGLAAGKVDVMMPLLRDWDFDALMTHNRFTLLSRNAEPMLDYAVQNGIVVLNAAPYGSGILAKGAAHYPRYVYQLASSEIINAVHAIESLCARHRVPLGAAALQFSMRDKRIAATICGVSRPERVKQTLEWATIRIPDRFWEELAAFSFDTHDPEATRLYRPG